MLILLLHHISHLPPSFNNHHFENFNHSIPWKCLLFTHQSTGTMPCPHQTTNQTNTVTIVCVCPHFNPFFTVSFFIYLLLTHRLDCYPLFRDNWRHDHQPHPNKKRNGAMVSFPCSHLQPYNISTHLMIYQHTCFHPELRCIPFILQTI